MAPPRSREGLEPPNVVRICKNTTVPSYHRTSASAPPLHHGCCPDPHILIPEPFPQPAILGFQLRNQLDELSPLVPQLGKLGNLGSPHESMNIVNVVP